MGKSYEDRVRGEDQFSGYDLLKWQEELQAERDALEEEVNEKASAWDDAQQALEEGSQEGLKEYALQQLTEAVDEASEELAEAKTALEEWDALDSAEDLRQLNAFIGSVGEDICRNEGFIADCEFVEYAKQFADDIGATNNDMKWPLNHIDWRAAADELQNDYSCEDLFGTTYWYRA